MKYIHPIQRIETRELSVKEFNEETGFILYNFRVPQGVEINLDITPTEIEWLYKAHKKITKQYKKMMKR